MSILDNIEKSRVEISKETDINCCVGSFKNQYFMMDSLCKPGRLFIKAFPYYIECENLYTRCELYYKDVSRKLYEIPEVEWVSEVYITNAESTKAEIWISIDLNIRTAYQFSRVLCSLISIFCTVDDGIVWISTYDEGLVYDYLFTTALVTYERFAEGCGGNYSEFEKTMEVWDCSNKCKDLFVYVLGHSVCDSDYHKCTERICKLKEMIR